MSPRALCVLLVPIPQQYERKICRRVSSVQQEDSRHAKELMMNRIAHYVLLELMELAWVLYSAPDARKVPFRLAQACFY